MKGYLVILAWMVYVSFALGAVLKGIIWIFS